MDFEDRRDTFFIFGILKKRGFLFSDKLTGLKDERIINNSGIFENLKIIVNLGILRKLR